MFVVVSSVLSYWDVNKMANILQTTSWNVFSSKKILVFWFKFHRGLFLKVQLPAWVQVMACHLTVAKTLLPKPILIKVSESQSHNKLYKAHHPHGINQDQDIRIDGSISPIAISPWINTSKAYHLGPATSHKNKQLLQILKTNDLQWIIPMHHIFSSILGS